MRRPIIGIACDHDRPRTRCEVGYAYVRAVHAAGGVPLALPFPAGDPAEALDPVDGLLLTGGNDPDPAAWGEEWHPQCVPVDPARERFDRGLLAVAAERRIPVLGICFGMQLMNIVRGGSLIQYLPDIAGTQEHRRLGEHDWQRRHAVNVTPGSVLARICGPEPLEVNTSHRQAVGRLGEGLTASGRAEDGVIEAIEDGSLPLWLGVQWHAERLAAGEADEGPVTGDSRQMALFSRLVEAAGVAR